MGGRVNRGFPSFLLLFLVSRRQKWPRHFSNISVLSYVLRFSRELHDRGVCQSWHHRCRAVFGGWTSVIESLWLALQKSHVGAGSDFVRVDSCQAELRQDAWNCIVGWFVAKLKPQNGGLFDWRRWRCCKEDCISRRLVAIGFIYALMLDGIEIKVTKQLFETIQSKTTGAT